MYLQLLLYLKLMTILAKDELRVCIDREVGGGGGGFRDRRGAVRGGGGGADQQDALHLALRREAGLQEHK